MGRFSNLETALWAATAAISLLGTAWAVLTPARGVGHVPTERVWPAVAAGVLVAVTAAVALGAAHVR